MESLPAVCFPAVWSACPEYGVLACSVGRLPAVWNVECLSAVWSVERLPTMWSVKCLSAMWVVCPQCGALACNVECRPLAFDVECRALAYNVECSALAYNVECRALAYNMLRVKVQFRRCIDVRGQENVNKPILLICLPNKTFQPFQFEFLANRIFLHFIFIFCQDNKKNCSPN